MKKLTFQVTLEFEDKIVDDLEINEVCSRIANALVHEVEHGNGLSPRNGDNYTKMIEVYNQVSDGVARITI